MLVVSTSWLTAPLLTILLARMVISGFIIRRGIFAWPMFSTMSMARIEGIREDGKDFNQWDFEIHADIPNTMAGAILVLDYAASVGTAVEVGSLTIFDHKGQTRYVITENRPWR